MKVKVDHNNQDENELRLYTYELVLKSIYLVVRRLTESSIVASFFMKFLFSHLISIPTVKRLILSLNEFWNHDIFTEKKKMKNFPLQEKNILDSSRFQKYHIYGFHFTGELPMASNRWVVGGNWRRYISTEYGGRTCLCDAISLRWRMDMLSNTSDVIILLSKMYRNRNVCKLCASIVNNTTAGEKRISLWDKKVSYIILDIPLT